MATIEQLNALLAEAKGPATPIMFPPYTDPKHIAAAAEAQALMRAHLPDALAARIAAVKAGQPDPLDVKLGRLKG